MSGRFDTLTDQERALLAFAITTLFMDALLGVITGEPWDDKHLARDIPVLVALFDDLGARYDTALDPELIDQLLNSLEQCAKADEARGNGHGASQA